MAVETAQVDGHGAGGGLQEQQAHSEGGPHVERTLMMVHGHGLPECRN